MRAQPVEERFNEYTFPEPNTGCWIWAGSLNKGGYGVIRNGDKIVRAHRLSYVIKLMLERLKKANNQTAITSIMSNTSRSVKLLRLLNGFLKKMNGLIVVQ